MAQAKGSPHQQLPNAIQGLTRRITLAEAKIAQTQSTATVGGGNAITFSETLPDSAKVGDVWYQTDSDGNITGNFQCVTAYTSGEGVSGDWTDYAIDGTVVAAGTIGNSQLGSGAVGTSNIQANAVTEALLGSDVTGLISSKSTVKVNLSTGVPASANLGDVWLQVNSSGNITGIFTCTTAYTSGGTTADWSTETLSSRAIGSPYTYQQTATPNTANNASNPPQLNDLWINTGNSNSIYQMTGGTSASPTWTQFQFGSAALGTGAVGNTQLASNAVASSNIQTGAVGSTQIASGAVGNTQLGSAAVATSNIQAGAVGNAQSQASFYSLNMVADPQFSNSSLNSQRIAAPTNGTWTIASNAASITATVHTQIMYLTPAAALWVNPGEQYYFSVQVTTTDVCTVGIGIENTAATASFQASQAISAAGTYTISGTGTVPSGFGSTGFIRLYILGQGSGTPTATFSMPVCTPAIFYAPTIEGGTIEGGQFVGTDFILNSDGLFYYDNNNNLLAAVGSVAGTDPTSGQTYIEGFQVGVDGSNQVQIVPNSPYTVTLAGGNGSTVSGTIGAAVSIPSPDVYTGNVFPGQLSAITLSSSTPADDSYATLLNSQTSADFNTGAGVLMESTTGYSATGPTGSTAVTMASVTKDQTDPNLVTVKSNMTVYDWGFAVYDPPSGASSAIITSSGTWTAPAGVTSVLVRCWAGGGGGQGGAKVNLGGGQGGGGGEYASSYVTVTPGNIYTIAVGAGGAAGTGSATTVGGSGSAGGNTTFAGDSHTVTAHGGKGGGTPGGTGGTGSTDTWHYNGGNGFAESGNSTFGGGGGSGSANYQAGNPATSQSGATRPGEPVNVPTNPGQGGYGGNTSTTAGTPGQVQGGGGGGGWGYASATGTNAGAGGAGYVTLAWSGAAPQPVTFLNHSGSSVTDKFGNTIPAGFFSSIPVQSVQPGSTTTAETWHTVSSLSNSWTLSTVFRYKLYADNTVGIQGEIVAPSGASNPSVIYTLPSGYLPTQDIQIPVTSHTAGSPYTPTAGTIRITTGGVVELYGAISSGNILTLNLRFPLD